MLHEQEPIQDNKQPKGPDLSMIEVPDEFKVDSPESGVSEPVASKTVPVVERREREVVARPGDPGYDELLARHQQGEAVMRAAARAGGAKTPQE